jgi:hypothetical protein
MNRGYYINMTPKPTGHYSHKRNSLNYIELAYITNVIVTSFVSDRRWYEEYECLDMIGKGYGISIAKANVKSCYLCMFM